LHLAALKIFILLMMTYLDKLAEKPELKEWKN